MKNKLLLKLIGTFSILGPVAGIVSCGGGGKYKNPTIASIMCDPENQRFQRANDETKKMIKKLGFNADSTLKKSQKDQNAWVDAAISKGAKAIIMAPSDSNGASKVVKKAFDNKIPFVDYDKLITGTDKYDYYVTFDNAAIGKLEAYGVALQVFGMNVNNEGFIVDAKTKKDVANGKTILQSNDDDIINLIKKASKNILGVKLIGWLGGSPTDNNAKVIYAAQKTFMDKLYGLNNVKPAWAKYEFSQVSITEWKREVAKTKVESFLNNGLENRINGIVCANDTTALGAVQALKNKLATNVAKIKDIYVAGQDATENAINSIKEGGESFTVAKPDTLLAPIAVLIAKFLIKNPKSTSTEIETKIKAYLKEENIKIEYKLDKTSYSSKPGHPVNTFLIKPKPVTSLTSEVTGK